MTSRSVGVCYYPEHWPEGVWPEDVRRMAEAGLRKVRIGEFVWSRCEPAPGRYDWGWLDRAIGVLADAGLEVVLGTPTATPPKWLVDRMPDMVALDGAGRPRRFGSRRHYCFSHEGYRAECRRIVEAMAGRYGRDPRITAWQTDNEYGCHDTAVSYSPAARHAFQEWCARRYRSPDALNRAWGNVFWSMEVRDFDEVELPNLTVTEPNPAHVLAFRRFSSDQVASFNREQTEVLRKRTDADLIHNYMGRETGFDHWDVGADLDVASWDSYPIGFLSDRLDLPAEHKRLYLRQGDPDMQAFHHDLYRSVGSAKDGRSPSDGRWWIMEQQPGPVNWAPHNPAPLPGMARLWAHEAFAHGAESVLYFRWRQAPFAQEQQHAGLLRPDSVAAPGLAEAAEVAGEVADEAPGTAPGQVALVFDYPSAWAWETQPQGADFEYLHLCLTFYRAARKLGLDLDVIPAGTADLSPWPLVLIPGLATVPDALRGAIAAHGARVLAGPRANAKTPEMAIPLPLPPDLPGLDCTVALVESLPPSADMPLAGGGALTRWREALEGGADVVEALRDGRPAAMAARTEGGGRLTYLGGWPDDAAALRIVRREAEAAGLAVRDLPEGVRTRRTPTHRVWLNYAAEARDTPAGRLPPAGVIREPITGSARRASDPEDDA
ncbi:beta-galactosidase [Hasllibacter halocynthiae]|uniref:Beta-galactosidase n=1 Tax=Hasllibacter halocynthiae TaxID=595589 RepID=A0A2T0X6M7_9RHOB|nr:beta-galactosidase [Hasllibacter halocynthiae]PRY94586.1 beta-galactosidase [Hasllibacter halocynthiae]